MLCSPFWRHSPFWEPPGAWLWEPRVGVELRASECVGLRSARLVLPPYRSGNQDSLRGRALLKVWCSNSSIFSVGLSTSTLTPGQDSKPPVLPLTRHGPAQAHSAQDYRDALLNRASSEPQSPGLHANLSQSRCLQPDSRGKNPGLRLQLGTAHAVQS